MYINKNVKSANHIFYIRTKMRDKLRRFLFKKNTDHYSLSNNSSTSILL